jgi:hypothetical protein
MKGGVVSQGAAGVSYVIDNSKHNHHCVLIMILICTLSTKLLQM